MNWIEWCKCGRRILTTGQIRDGLSCQLCQKEVNKEKHIEGTPNEEEEECVE